VVVVVIIHNQQPEQQVPKEREVVKVKGVKNWQQEECSWIHSLKP